MGLFDFFKKASRSVQPVLQSEQINKNGFDEYFKGVADYEGAYWGEDGHLYAGEGDGKIIISFSRFNLRMNEQVCKQFGEEKCQEIAKVKGWYYNDDLFGTMLDKKGGSAVLWYNLHEAISKI